MVKNHSDSKRENPVPPHGLLFLISCNGSFICTIAHTSAFVTPVVEQWLEEIAQWVHHEGSIWHLAPSPNTVRDGLVVFFLLLFIC